MTDFQIFTRDGKRYHLVQKTGGTKLTAARYRQGKGAWQAVFTKAMANPPLYETRLWRAVGVDGD